MRGRFALAASVAGLLPLALSAQVWTVDASAGRAMHDPVSARVDATSAALGIRYQAAGARWAYASAGAPLRADGAAWGSTGAGAWLGRSGDLALGIGLGGHIFGYTASDSAPAGGGGVGEVMPSIALQRGFARVELRSGAVGVADAVNGTTASRWLHDSGARFLVAVAEGVHIGAEGRYLRAPEDDYPYVGVTAEAVRRLGTVWAYGGRWVDGPLASPTRAIGIGALTHLGKRMELQASWQQEPMDPVFLNAPRRTWSVQLSRRIGRVAKTGAPASPPPSLHIIADGEVTFKLPLAEHTLAPAIAGDFTGWSPVPMEPEGEFWIVRLSVEPGVHHFGFRNHLGEWFVPPSYPTADDGMGGTSAVLVVPALSM